MNSTHLLLQRLSTLDRRGKLARLVQTGTKQTGDLLDHGVGRKEGMVGLGCEVTVKKGQGVVNNHPRMLLQRGKCSSQLSITTLSN